MGMAFVNSFSPVSQLNTQKVDLMKEMEKIKKKKPLLANMTQLQSLLNKSVTHEKPDSPPSKSLTKRQKKFQEEYIIPEPARHEHFDSSISKYFTQQQTNQKNTNHAVTSQVSHAQQKQAKLDQILLENIYRMFGITAFPVSDPSKGIKRELLGIRIEIFNETESKFETPHYLILEKNVKTLKWKIFKHTIPIYLKLEQLVEDYDDLSDYKLYEFCCKLRDDLSKISYKHQIVERIRNDWGNNIKNMEKDLALDVLKFRLKIHDIETLVILNLSFDQIESCFIESGFTESEKLRISNVLKGDIKTFEKRIRDVITSLESS
ncbi:Central kinetochore subunit MCM21 [Wickerhamomyces ciferrii]|uniref:Central kinetochore subunit MCM21 n=1 Tax=Wickerhamomyces ciferrii (strain ATCC 14091 / BCRC 22168 / CBS 111 / JCM 3599 / NBRC 0793 / NRRL Y-1031 F-60-10) TaxID=1206466 RepID=K0KHM7_WICCF|nr:Central kinetochore subunit MCM21 [Wickerhamomyces ciferrii]CCH41677.1 Central kinetochore subunit MCM21 [Wickerhamomyces ciferrii]